MNNKVLFFCVLLCILLTLVSTSVTAQSTFKQTSRADANELDEAGGPDDFGYTYMDSQEEEGPSYLWLDISDTGTLLELDDNDISDPILLPFNFFFYENIYTEVRIGSNGYLLFDNESTEYLNHSIPSGLEPNNAIYFFWDNLDPSAGGEIYYHNHPNGRWICQFQDVREAGDDGTITAQVMLNPNGDIKIQYQEFADDIDITSETIGFENEDGTDGLRISHITDPDDYPFDELALFITPGEGESSVWGLVFDCEFAGFIDNANVEFRGYGTYNADTNMDGEYLVEGIWPGTYDVTVETGWLAPLYTQVNIGPGLNEHHFELNFNPELTYDPEQVLLETEEGWSDSAVVTLGNTGNVEPICIEDLNFSIIPLEPEEVLMHPFYGMSSEEIIEYRRDNMGPLMDRSDWGGASSPEVYQSMDAWHPGQYNELDEGPYLVLSTTTITNSLLLALDNLGIDYTHIPTTNWDEQDFTGYNTIIIGMDGGTGNSDDYQAVIDFCEAGGIVFWFGGTNWTHYYNAMQDFIEHSGEIGWDTPFVPHFNLVDETHELAENLPDDYTFDDYGAAGYCIRITDEDAEVVAENGDGWPCLVSKQFGDGVLLYFINSAAGDEWEDPDDFDLLETIMENMLNYSLEHPWLSVEPQTGIIEAEEEIDIQVFADAEELTPGEYEAFLRLITNDPDNDPLDLPVTFTVSGPDPPGEFNLLTPEDGTIFNDFEVELTWEEAIDPDPGDEVVYDLYVSLDPGNMGDPLAADLEDEAYTFTADEQGEWYWTVHARDTNTEFGTWANQTRSFIIDTPDLPTNFALLEPEDGVLILIEEMNAVTTVWEESVDPDLGENVTYNVYFSVMPDSLTPQEFNFTGIEDTSYTVDLPTLAGVEYWSEFEVYWHVEAVSGEDIVQCDSIFGFHIEPNSSVKEGLFNGIPDEYDIAAAYPNPFNPLVNIVLAIPLTGNVRIEVFDILGRQVALLHDQTFEPGYHNLNWTAEGPSGIYFLNVSSDNGWSKIHKLVFMK